MLTFKNLTGKKEQKGAYEEVVILSPTKGEFKLSPLVQEKLGVKKGDFGLVVEDGGVVYIGKGKSGVAKLGEDGKPIKSDRNRTVFEEDGFGGIISPAAEGSDLLRITAALGWVAAGGNKEFNRYFKLGEPVEAQVPTGEVDELTGEDVMFATTFYPLIHEKDIAKQKKEKKSKDETDTPVANSIQLDNENEPVEIEDEDEDNESLLEDSPSEEI